MLLPLQGAGIVGIWHPGCRFALPRAVCSLPRWGAYIQDTSVQRPEDNVAWFCWPTYKTSNLLRIVYNLPSNTYIVTSFFIQRTTLWKTERFVEAYSWIELPEYGHRNGFDRSGYNNVWIHPGTEQSTGWNTVFPPRQMGRMPVSWLFRKKRVLFFAK